MKALAVVDEKLDRLEPIGALSSSDQAAVVVTVPKKDVKVRLCGDHKVRINSAVDVDQYQGLIDPRGGEGMHVTGTWQNSNPYALMQSRQQLLL